MRSTKIFPTTFRPLCRGQGQKLLHEFLERLAPASFLFLSEAKNQALLIFERSEKSSLLNFEGFKPERSRGPVVQRQNVSFAMRRQAGQYRPGPPLTKVGKFFVNKLAKVSPPSAEFLDPARPYRSPLGSIRTRLTERSQRVFVANLWNKFAP